MKLEVKNLHKSFGEKEVLHGISFAAKSGKALGLLGSNGAGKTTTIRIIMDVFHANSGEILIDGKKFNAREHGIGYLPEERGLYPKKKVAEQMIYLGRLHGLSKTEAAKNTDYWLNKLHISEYKNSKLETLSKGNQQKVQVAATLVSNPDIVILDEPFSGLDPVNAQLLKDVVNELIASDKIVIFSSHQMSYVEEFCENILIINKGEVVLEGNLLDIKYDFGKNQILINAEDKTPDKLAAYLKSDFSEYVEVNSVTDAGCIIKRINNTTKSMFLKKLIDSNIDIERFEDFKPSLNDIFVAKAGDES